MLRFFVRRLLQAALTVTGVLTLGFLLIRAAGDPAALMLPENATAADVARLGSLAFARGEAVAPERIEPAYLRNNVALTIAEQQALRASSR